MVIVDGREGEGLLLDDVLDDERWRVLDAREFLGRVGAGAVQGRGEGGPGWCARGVETAWIGGSAVAELAALHDGGAEGGKCGGAVVCVVARG